MKTPTEHLTAHESVWVHRIRQRIALERIILSIGNPREQQRAKQFLTAIEQAHPELLEDFEQYALDLFYESDEQAPELFDESEYAAPKGRKTALKMPQDIVWEERIVRRAAREYRDLFHPCANAFHNAMKGLTYLKNLHPKLFARAREQAIAQREEVLTRELYCRCDCITPEHRQPAEAFNIEYGRFETVTRRIADAKQAIAGTSGNTMQDWSFFLDRIGEIAPEMLNS